jgi:DegV family protein with EDD domain
VRKIALVTDSTSDLTEDVRTLHDIHVIPMKLRFADEEFTDGTLSSEDFYRRLAEEKVLPKTSQPSPEEFGQLYSRLLEEYQEIISIHISSGLSGTLNAAYLAKEKLATDSIHVVDSKSISLGLGLLVMEAARLIKEGIKITGILERLAKARENLETLFTLNTLEYLQKGGRIGKVNSLAGTILNIKPVIRVGDDGIYHSFAMARGQDRAINCIIKAFQRLVAGRKDARLAVAHGAALEVGKYLKEALENAIQIPVSIFTQVGPVIGAHTGPGTVGAALLFE